MTEHFILEGIIKCKLTFIYLEMSSHLMKLLISVTFRYHRFRLT